MDFNGDKIIFKSFSEWVRRYEGFEYYNSQLEKIFLQFEVKCHDHYAFVSYKGYLILVMLIENKSIFLVRDYPKNAQHPNEIVQKKLLHEYESTFRLNKLTEQRRPINPSLGEDDSEGVLSLEGNGGYYPFNYNEYSFTIWGDSEEFKLTQMNQFLLRRYLEKAKTKIDLGFERYNMILEEQGLHQKEDVGFLKVYLDGSYSLSELNDLLDAYNRLYSVIKCVCDYGYDETDEMPISDVLTKNSMVLEQISIASPGFFVSVLSGVAANILTHLIEAWISGDNAKAEEYKNEALNQAGISCQEDIDKVEIIFQRLERNIKRKKDGYLPQGIVDIEIQRDLEKIKQLQGIPSINKLV